MPKLGIQGGEASYHEIAALQLHPDAEISYHDTFPNVFTALRERQIGTAVVAIANNRVQFIAEPFEEIMHHLEDFSIIGETYLRVNHALLGPKGATLDSITEVHSQVEALDQCRSFLGHRLGHARIVEQHDTAASAKLVAEWGDPTKAAIASTSAGKLYGLDVVQSGVQDDPANFTRFLEITRAGEQPIGEATKTTMTLQTPQKPGALVDALSPFKRENINLSNLHSRIIPNTAFHMMFFVEFDAGLQEAKTKAVLKDLEAGGNEYHILGSYIGAEIPKQ